MSDRMDAISVPLVNEAFVLAKCKYFLETQVWPLKSRIDPEGWLRNFTKSDRHFAVHLLNGFMYFSNHLVDQLFLSAFRGLGRTVVDHLRTPGERRTQWHEFLDEVVVTYPTGESPSEADSGHSFVRRARDLMGIPESRIMSPDRALEAIIGDRIKRVVFVDDFVGSGAQFAKTWNRRIPNLSDRSFASHRIGGVEVFYAPLFCTQFALEHTLLGLMGQVRLCPAHVLTSEYSALNDPSIFWPDSLKAKAKNFVRGVSEAIGLPDGDGCFVDDWQGFCKLGLAISFADHIPDATLPIFYTTVGGWTPLWRRPQ